MRKLALILGALSAFGSLSIDMYLPSFRAISRDLAASDAQVQLTLAVFFGGLGLGQAFYGPVSDRHGRMRPLCFGLSLFVLASAACALAISGMFAYIFGSPFVFIQIHGVRPERYGWLFGLNALGLISASQLNSVLLRRFAGSGILSRTLVVTAAAGVFLFAAAWRAPGGSWDCFYRSSSTSRAWASSCRT